MSVLAAVLSPLVDYVSKPPATAKSGGTSTGDNTAGISPIDLLPSKTPVTTGDSVGAIIVMLLLIGGVTAIFGSMTIREQGG